MVMVLRAVAMVAAVAGRMVTIVLEVLMVEVMLE